MCEQPSRRPPRPVCIETDCGLLLLRSGQNIPEVGHGMYGLVEFCASSTPTVGRNHHCDDENHLFAGRGQPPNAPHLTISGSPRSFCPDRELRKPCPGHTLQMLYRALSRLLAQAGALPTVSTLCTANTAYANPLLPKQHLNGPHRLFNWVAGENRLTAAKTYTRGSLYDRSLQSLSPAYLRCVGFVVLSFTAFSFVRRPPAALLRMPAWALQRRLSWC